MSAMKQLTILALILCLVQNVYPHARLMEPPSRSSMWRHGFSTPKNYDDDGLYCGGIEIQWKKNGGKCGICGDPWHHPAPRPNEAGGKFGNGIIVRSYKTGQVIPAAVDVTANHRGYFEFRVCPSKNPTKEVIQECLDKHTLTIVNSTSTRYFVDKHGRETVTLGVRLPKSLTCKHCVLQWTYVAGNNWGRCKDGTTAIGCGPQETFRGCSDIAIGSQKPTSAHSHSTKPPKDKKKFTVSRPTRRPQRPKLQDFSEAAIREYFRRRRDKNSFTYYQT